MIGIKSQEGWSEHGEDIGEVRQPGYTFSSPPKGVTHLPLVAIRRDSDTQARTILDPTTLEDYALAMARGDVFPAITAFFDGTDCWAADGHHRLSAAKAVGLTDILVDVKAGTKADAVWFALGANAAHGLRRKREDVRRAIELALKHPKSSGMSDVKIAAHVGCSDKTVAMVRNATSEIPKSTVRTGSDGRTINTAAIGKGRTSAPEPPTIDGEAIDITPRAPDQRVDAHNVPPSDADGEKMALQERVVALEAQLEAVRGQFEAEKAAKSPPDVAEEAPLAGSDVEDGSLGACADGEPVAPALAFDPLADGMALVEQARALLAPLGWVVDVVRAKPCLSTLATASFPEEKAKPDTEIAQSQDQALWVGVGAHKRMSEYGKSELAAMVDAGAKKSVIAERFGIKHQNVARTIRTYVEKDASESSSEDSAALDGEVS